MVGPALWGKGAQLEKHSPKVSEVYLHSPGILTLHRLHRARVFTEQSPGGCVVSLFQMEEGEGWKAGFQSKMRLCPQAINALACSPVLTVPHPKRCTGPRANPGGPASSPECPPIPTSQAQATHLSWTNPNSAASRPSWRDVSLKATGCLDCSLGGSRMAPAG